MIDRMAGPHLFAMHEAVCLRQVREGVVQAVGHSQAATLDTEATVHIEAAEQHLKGKSECRIQSAGITDRGRQVPAGS